MSYKNDSYLVIANKFGSAGSQAKAQLWETYDKLRDLTISGSGEGTGWGTTGSFLYRMASLMAPSAYSTIFGSSESMNIPGTSYYSSLNGGSAFGLNSLYNYSGFPGGAERGPCVRAAEPPLSALLPDHALFSPAGGRSAAAPDGSAASAGAHTVRVLLLYIFFDHGFRQREGILPAQRP